MKNNIALYEKTPVHLWISKLHYHGGDGLEVDKIPRVFVGIDKYLNEADKNGWLNTNEPSYKKSWYPRPEPLLGYRLIGITDDELNDLNNYLVDPIGLLEALSKM